MSTLHGNELVVTENGLWEQILRPDERAKKKGPH